MYKLGKSENKKKMLKKRHRPRLGRKEENRRIVVCEECKFKGYSEQVRRHRQYEKDKCIRVEKGLPLPKHAW